MLRFATPGVPASTPGAGGTVAGIRHAASLGIKAMEIEWVQSVPKNPARMAEVRAVRDECGFTLTVHAPYFVNLNSDEPAKLDASIRRILDALSMSELCGAWSVCVHAAFYGGKDPAIAYDNVRKATESILKHKDKLFPHVNLAYETMGKQSQFGTLEEILKVSSEFDLIPCIDPAHLHARANGGVNTAEEWHAMLDAYQSALGKKSLEQVHFHYSGIAYGAKGEKHHLTLEESDARWMDFLAVLKERKVGGTVVCESPAMERDTLVLQEAYTHLK